MIDVSTERTVVRVLAGATGGLVLAALVAAPSGAADGAAPLVGGAVVASRTLVLGASGTPGTSVSMDVTDVDGIGSVTVRFLDPGGVVRRSANAMLVSGSPTSGRWTAPRQALPVTSATGAWRVELVACDSAAACGATSLGTIAVRRATAMTEVAASPRRVVGGKKTTVESRLLGMTAGGRFAALPGTPVALRFRAASSTRWTHVRTLRTSSKGRVAVAVTPKSSGAWHIVYAGSPTFQAREGAALGVDVSAVKSWVFGRSVKKRALRVHRIGDPKAARRVLVIGSVHGNERAGIKVVTKLRSMAPPKGVVYYLVPNLNPDGAKANTRQNARGVDLNRNFTYRWRANGNTWGTYYPGPRAASEPEVRAAQRLIREVSPTLSIWYHQHMNLVDPAAGPRAVAKAYGKATGLRVKKLVSYRGSASSWQGATWSKRPVFIVELPRRVNPAKVTRHAKAVRTVSAVPKD